MHFILPVNLKTKDVSIYFNVRFSCISLSSERKKKGENVVKIKFQTL